MEGFLLRARIVWRRLGRCLEPPVYYDHPSDSPRISASELEEIGRTARNSEHALPWRSALRSRNLWAILLSGLSYRYGICFFQFWLPTYLVSGRGYAETALLLTTWLFAGGAVANVAGGWASDALVRRLGLKMARRTVPFTGLVISAVSLILTIFVAGKYYLLALLSLSYCGITFAQAPCWTVCMDVGVRFTGAVSGARNTTSQVGATISSIVFGYMLRTTGSYNIALIPVIGMIAACAMFCLRIDATEQLFPESIARAT